MAAEPTGPEYQRLMRLIRSRIIAGGYPIGSLIPSTTKLVEETKLSQPVVRRAVDQLKAEGILEGHPGKGVYVKAMPADAGSARVTVDQLSGRVARVQQVADKAAKDAAGYDDLRELYDDLRLRVAHLETELMDLKAGNGTLTQGGEHDQEDQQPRRRQPAR